MDADLFRNFLDHHRLQRIGAVIEKLALPRNDALTHAENRVFALLNIFQELNRGGEALLDVVANVAIGSVAGQQASIRWTEAKLRHVVFVQEDLPDAIDFAE